MLEHLFAGGGSAAPGLRSAAAARQEDIGERNPARGALSSQPKTAGRHAKKTVSDTLAVACSNLAAQAAAAPRRWSGSPATTVCGTARRDHKDHRRSADLQLSPGSRADPMTIRPTERGGGQCQAGLSGDEGVPNAARAPCRRRAGA